MSERMVPDNLSASLPNIACIIYGGKTIKITRLSPNIFEFDFENRKMVINKKKELVKPIEKECMLCLDFVEQHYDYDFYPFVTLSRGVK